MAGTTPILPLADVIEELRRELLTAIAKGAEEPLRFRLKPVELELQVVVTKGVEADAGVKFWVLNLGAKGSASDALTHSLKLTLEPVYRDGDEDTLISALVEQRASSAAEDRADEG